MPTYRSTTSWTMRRPGMAALPAALLCACALATSAFAGGPTQPDPPVPAEARAGSDAPLLLASAQGVTRVTPRVQRTSSSPRSVAEPDCRCGALYVRDLERRVEGHVERWEAMRHASGPGDNAMPAAATVAPAPPALVLATPVALAADGRAPLRVAAWLVDGMVGFPLHDFRLAD